MEIRQKRDWFGCDKIKKRWFPPGSTIGRCNIPELDVGSTNFSAILDDVLSSEQPVPTMLRHAAPAQRTCLERSSALSGPLASKSLEFKKNNGAMALTTLGDFTEELMPGCAPQLDGTPCGVVLGLDHESRELTVMCPDAPASILSQSLQVTTEKMGREIEVRLGGLFVGAAFTKEAQMDTWVDVIHGRLKWLLHEPTCSGVDVENAFAVWMKSSRNAFDHYCTGKGCAGDDFTFSPKDTINTGAAVPVNCTEFRPLECVQGPGDVLFIPKGWHYSSFHLAETVYAVERGTPLALEEKLASIATAKGILEAVAAVRPEDRGIDSSFFSEVFSEENRVLSGAPKSIFDNVLPHEQVPSPPLTLGIDPNTKYNDKDTRESDDEEAQRRAAHEVVVDVVTGHVSVWSSARGGIDGISEWTSMGDDDRRPSKARYADDGAGKVQIMQDATRQQRPPEAGVWPPPHAPFGDFADDV